MSHFKRIDHTEIVTQQLEATIDFYVGTLGFELRFRDRVESPLGPLEFVYLDLNGTRVELLSYPEATVAPPIDGERVGYRMIALEVDDMQRAIEHLRSRHVDVVWGPKIRPTYSRAEILDPNGLPIELRQWHRAP
jgi:glyoxylase I family protein